MLSVKEINLLEAQNEGLKKQNADLQKENAKLKALCDTYRTCYQAKHSDIKGLLFKYKQTLQEIKKYLKGHKIADEVRIKCVLDLITKESEVE